MRALIFLIVIAFAAWHGWKRYHDEQITVPAISAPSTTAPATQPYSEAVQYKKCVTAEGQVIFGEVPANVTCAQEEDITSKISLVPAVSQSTPTTSATDVSQAPPSPTTEAPLIQKGFACDGRTHCSQMRSCDEAKYFLEHCPNTEMDGNNDGVPCEKQWCNILSKWQSSDRDRRL